MDVMVCVILQLQRSKHNKRVDLPGASRASLALPVRRYPQLASCFPFPAIPV